MCTLLCLKPACASASAQALSSDQADGGLGWCAGEVLPGWRMVGSCSSPAIPCKHAFLGKHILRPLAWLTTRLAPQPTEAGPTSEVHAPTTAHQAPSPRAASRLHAQARAAAAQRQGAWLPPPRLPCRSPADLLKPACLRALLALLAHVAAAASLAALAASSSGCSSAALNTLNVICGGAGAQGGAQAAGQHTSKPLEKCHSTLQTHRCSGSAGHGCPPPPHKKHPLTLPVTSSRVTVASSTLSVVRLLSMLLLSTFMIRGTACGGECSGWGGGAEAARGKGAAQRNHLACTHPPPAARRPCPCHPDAPETPLHP